MTTLLRLDPPISLITTKGTALAHIYADNGLENDSTWVCFNEDGEIWELPNSEVRACKNVTVGRTNPNIPINR